MKRTEAERPAPIRRQTPPHANAARTAVARIAPFLMMLSLAGMPPAAARPVPKLDPGGEVYKTEGPNDPLIYDSTTGDKSMIMLYLDFPGQHMETPTEARAEKVLGGDRVEQLFHTQSHGKLRLDIDHVHGWRRLPKARDTYTAVTTEGHRDLFVDVFALYPEVDFHDYDYIVANIPGLGNFAFGERDDQAIPYRDGKIRVAVNIGSTNPIVLVHELAHLMGLPDLYTIGDPEGPKNPVGSWDIMADGNRASGFIGWHRHKLGWLDADRKTYLTEGVHRLELAPLDAPSGTSLAIVPVDSAERPHKVFAVEIAQPARPREGREPAPHGVLIYQVDATRATGKNPVIIHPRDTLERAPFQPGDRFEDDGAPMDVRVLEALEDNAYRVEIRVKDLSEGRP